MNMVPLYGAWLYQYVGPLQVKRRKKKKEITSICLSHESEKPDAL